MKAILINIIVSVPIVYILLLLSRIFKELGHLIMYRIMFKDDNYVIKVGFGKRLLKTKRWEINRMPILSKITYGDKFQQGTYKSLLTHIGGGLGTIAYLICLIPLIYLVNKKPEVIAIMNSKILPITILRTIQIVILTLYFSIMPLQIPYFPNGGYISDGVYVINDIMSMKNKKNKKYD